MIWFERELRILNSVDFVSGYLTSPKSTRFYHISLYPQEERAYNHLQISNREMQLRSHMNTLFQQRDIQLSSSFDMHVCLLVIRDQGDLPSISSLFERFECPFDIGDLAGLNRSGWILACQNLRLDTLDISTHEMKRGTYVKSRSKIQCVFLDGVGSIKETCSLDAHIGFREWKGTEFLGRRIWEDEGIEMSDTSQPDDWLFDGLMRGAAGLLCEFHRGLVMTARQVAVSETDTDELLGVQDSFLKRGYNGPGRRESEPWDKSQMQRRFRAIQNQIPFLSGCSKE